MKLWKDQYYLKLVMGLLLSVSMRLTNLISSIFEGTVIIMLTVIILLVANPLEAED